MKIIKLILLLALSVLCVFSKEVLVLSVISSYIYIGYNLYKFMYK